MHPISVGDAGGVAQTDDQGHLHGNMPTRSLSTPVEREIRLPQNNGHGFQGRIAPRLEYRNGSIYHPILGKFQEEGRGAARDGHPGVQIRQFSRGLGVFFQSLTCPYCQQAKSALRAAGFVPKVVNVNSSLREELLALTGKTSVPSVWIGNKYIGGCNDGAESWMGTIPNIQNGNIKKWIEVRISRAYFVSSGKEIVFCRQRNHHRFNQRPSTIDRS